MPTIHNWQEWLDMEELRSMLKADIQKQAAEIPNILKKKQEEYV